MNISKTNFVEAYYKLTENDENGTLIENNFEAEPLGFVYGVGMMIPGFEEHIEGLKVGDSKGFQVKSADAYGEHMAENVVGIPIENFGDEEQRKENVEEGKMLVFNDQQGRQHRGFVKEIGETEVKIDFNHPMAGKDLYFFVEIKSIRETTKDELEQMGLVFE